MAIAIIPWWVVLIWAVFATVFYVWRYRKVDSLKNPLIIIGLFALHMFFFAWSALIFILIELVRYNIAKKKKEP